MGEDEDMAKMMAEWDANNDGEENSSSSEGSGEDEPLTYDDMLEKFRRDVDPGDNELDHIVLGVSDLDKAVEDWEKLTGTAPVFVVSLNGMGIKSARVSFKECVFIEIIGPDPKQEFRHLGGKLKDIPAGHFEPFHFAVRSSSCDERKQIWKDMGLTYDMVTMIAKDRGMPWKWDMFILQEHGVDGMMPYFCNWREAKHASGRLPIMGDSCTVKLTMPEDSHVHKVLADISGIELSTGSPKFELEFDTETGHHAFEADNMVGITFPM